MANSAGTLVESFRTAANARAAAGLWADGGVDYREDSNNQNTIINFIFAMLLSYRIY